MRIHPYGISGSKHAPGGHGNGKGLRSPDAKAHSNVPMNHAEGGFLVNQGLTMAPTLDAGKGGLNR